MKGENNMSQSSTAPGTGHWERQTLQKLLLEHIVEQRRARRWGIFFKLIFLVLVILAILVAFGALSNKELPQPSASGQSHTALIDIKGPIMEDEEASADNIRSSLKTAYENKHVKGI